MRLHSFSLWRVLEAQKTILLQAPWLSTESFCHTPPYNHLFILNLTYFFQSTEFPIKVLQTCLSLWVSPSEDSCKINQITQVVMPIFFLSFFYSDKHSMPQYSEIGIENSWNYLVKSLITCESAKIKVTWHYNCGFIINFLVNT